jgi:hypothetical protein
MDTLSCARLLTPQHRAAIEEFPMSDAPVWVQIVVSIFGLVCLGAAVWAARTHKNSPRDWDYRDDL